MKENFRAKANEALNNYKELEFNYKSKVRFEDVKTFDADGFPIWESALDIEAIREIEKAKRIWWEEENKYEKFMAERRERQKATKKADPDYQHKKEISAAKAQITRAKNNIERLKAELEENQSILNFYQKKLEELNKG